jgi:hypothetical protein
MTEHIIIPRVDSDSKSVPVPHWRPFKAHTVPWETSPRVGQVVCSRGHGSDISLAVHQVADDGTLHPSYVCPTPGCDFHVWARLDGWEPPSET